MFCQKCGAQLDENMAFCMMCGAKTEKGDAGISETEKVISEVSEDVNDRVVSVVEQTMVDNANEANNAQTQPVSNSVPYANEEQRTMPIDYSGQNGMNVQKNNKKSGKAKKMILLIAALIVVVIVVIVGILFIKRDNKKTTSYTIDGYLDLDGNMYFLKENGKTVVVETEEGAQGWMTPDRGHIILYLDNEISIYNGKGELDCVLDENANSILAVRNTGILFQQTLEPSFEDVINALKDECNDIWDTDFSYDEILEYFDDWGYSRTVEDAKDFYYDIIGERFQYSTQHNLFRYTFDDEQSMEVDAYENIIIAEEDLTIAYTTDVGIYLLKETEDTAQKIQGQKHDGITLISLADQGNILVWSDNIRNTDSFFAEVYVANKGDINSLGKMEMEYSSFSINAILLNSKKEILCVSDSSEDVLYGTVNGTSAEKFSVKGSILPYGCYSQYGLLTSDIDKKINGFYTIIEANYDRDLFYVSLDGERERLLSDVEEIVGLVNGKIYYIKSDGSSENLYCAIISEDEIKNEERIAKNIDYVRICEDGRLYYLKDYDYYNGMGTLYTISSKGEEEKIATDVYWFIDDVDGKAMYYADSEEIGYGYYGYGTLYYGDKKIQADVLTYITFSEDNMKQMGLLQYDYIKENDDGTSTIMCNLCYYDGKKAERIASDVIYTTY